MSAAVVFMRQNRMMARFRAAGATHPDAARMPEEAGVRRSWMFRRMADRGVFVPTGDGRYYLDESAASSFVGRRTRRALTISGILLLIFILMMLTGVIR